MALVIVSQMPALESHNYKVQRPHANRSARGRAAISRAGGSAARGRALYGDAVRCNAWLGDTGP
jgi:hypothetical protein